MFSARFCGRPEQVHLPALDGLLGVLFFVVSEFLTASSTVHYDFLFPLSIMTG